MRILREEAYRFAVVHSRPDGTGCREARAGIVFADPSCGVNP